MQFEITILGCSSAIPTAERFPTSQLVNHANNYYLIDCGEGTQMQLRKYKLNFQRIDHIFISHAHADHFLGLPGLLSTMELLGRNNPLHIYAPSGVIQYINDFKKAANTGFQFHIEFHEIIKESSGIIYENDSLTVESVPLKHSVPCHGFIFREKLKSRRLKKTAITDFHLTIEQIQEAKLGNDIILSDGERIPNKLITTSPPHSRSYAFITDTLFQPNLTPVIGPVDILYHEATFCKQFENRAKETKHSTAAEAGKMAAMAGVKKLIIGHYSVRYTELEILLKETMQEFPDTELAYEGKIIHIGFESRT